MNPRQWYKEPWMWLVVGLPVASVIAGLTTVFIANIGADDPVVADYYKAGLAINDRLDQEKAAQALGISANVSFGDEQIQVQLNGNVTNQPPAVLTMSLIHPTLEDRDIQIRLKRQPSTGLYEAHVPHMPEGRYYVRLSDPKVGTWVLSGTVFAARGTTVTVSTSQ